MTMKFISKTFVSLFLLAFIFTSCSDSFDSLVNERLENNPIPEPISGDAGNAVLTNYVALGSSQTAGLMDGALYNNGQRFSLAALIAAQFQLAGAPESFNQPSINSSNGCNIAITDNCLSSTPLGRFKLDPSIPGPSPTVNGDPIQAYGGSTSELNNFGVPGIQIGQMLTPLTGGPQSPQNPAFNPFYARFASSPGSSTILGDALSTGPTFFTLWIGDNDLLGYALSGATNNNVFTSAEDFEIRINAVINTILNNSTANGVVATIPPILSFPFFRAVPHNPIPLSQPQADQLNQGYSAYNNGLQAARQGGLINEEEANRRTIQFSAGPNRFVMEDSDLTNLSGLGLPNWRQSEPTDLVLLTAAQAFPTGVGTQSAAPESLVLTPENQAEIQQRSNQFNVAIATSAIQNADRVALLDVNSGLPGNPNTVLGFYADLLGFDGEAGIRVDGTLLAPDFSPNGVYSTDGIHLNARGNAIVANEFLRAIESNFNASIPKVKVLNLPSVSLCAGDCVSQQ
jgi:hypothetical protein